jgi:hypothetical protein
MGVLAVLQLLAVPFVPHQGAVFGVLRYPVALSPSTLHITTSYKLPPL